MKLNCVCVRECVNKEIMEFCCHDVEKKPVALVTSAEPFSKECPRWQMQFPCALVCLYHSVLLASRDTVKKTKTNFPATINSLFFLHAPSTLTSTHLNFSSRGWWKQQKKPICSTMRTQTCRYLPHCQNLATKMSLNLTCSQTVVVSLKRTYDAFSQF